MTGGTAAHRAAQQQAGIKSEDRDAMNDDKGKSELSRREWLVKIGQAGAVAGIAGVVGDAEATCPQPAPSQTAPLPPGLYLPSNDHLTHALGANSLFHVIPDGSETDYRRPRPAPFSPQFFSPEDFKIIGRLVELVLGEPADSSEFTATAEGGPGSAVADIAEWVDLMAANSSGVRQAARSLAPQHRKLALHYHGREAVERLENTDVEAICHAGLAWMAKESKEKFGKDFLALGESEQAQLLSSMSNDPNTATAAESAREFFHWLRSQIINGFYRSPAGLKELDFKGNVFYAVSPGCAGHDHHGK